MRPIIISITSTTPSAWFPVDWQQVPFNVGLGVVLSDTPSMTLSVEHTFDDVNDASITPTAFSNAGLTDITSSDNGNYSAPIRAIRLNASIYATGLATLTILQGSKS